MIRTFHRLNLLAACLAATTSCGIEPNVPDLHHELNLAAIEGTPLADDPAAQDQLAGTLEMLFGTPQNPRYMLLEEWIDDEYDPNYGDVEILDDEGGFSEEYVESNRNHFKQQLAMIEEGRYEDLLEPLYAPELWARWLDHKAAFDGDPLAEDDEGYTWQDNAAYLFESFYPTLRESALMFRNQCYHCHGISGGGNGSTSEFLYPRPRDYRNGWFKFTALKDKARPRREDLFRVLTEGIYTTSMPTFRRFADSQLHGLVDYVKLLSIRGELELLLLDEYDADLGQFGGAETILELYAFVQARWDEAYDKLIAFDGDVPEATPELLARGRTLFLGEEGDGANCVSCHGLGGRGDGPSSMERDPETGELVRAQDDWGDPIEPRDLTRGVYRFGRRPIDLYRRVYAGINGTPMPEHIGMQITEADGSQRPLDEEDVWALVHFVRSLPDVHAASSSAAAQAAGSDAGSGDGGSAGQ